MERFALSDAQAQAILDMRLQRLTNLEILALRKEYADLKKRIAELEAILGSEKKLMNVIKKELRAVAERYGDARPHRDRARGRGGGAAAREEIIAEDALVTYSRAGLLRACIRRGAAAGGGGGRGGSAALPLRHADRPYALLLHRPGQLLPPERGGPAGDEAQRPRRAAKRRFGGP